MSLNPAQQKAVDTLSGPVLVLAGAGTGKTRVITARIANLIRHGTKPDRILGVTFTNKAAQEMQHRVGALLKKKSKSKPFLSTFHSLCLKILRQHITRLGYPPRFAIYDRSDQESIAREVLREVRMPEKMLAPSLLLYFVSHWKSNSVSPEEALRIADSDQMHLAAVAFGRYQRRLKNRGAVDFDDLLLCTEHLFREYADVAEEESQKFDQILIDEYQDTNTSQYRIIRTLAERHRNLCVVGDDDQSIYAWRGAKVENILNFKKDWPDAVVIYLQDNYRSTGPILHLANELIAFNAVRHEKVLRAARAGGSKPDIMQLPSEAKEAEEVVSRIRNRLSQPGIEPRDLAILFRTNDQPRVFEQELRKHKIPYILIGGTSFFDRKEVRDILAYLRAIEFPNDDVSVLRIINTPPRGIGQTTIERIQAAANQHEVPIKKIIDSPDLCPELHGEPLKRINSFASLLNDWKELSDQKRLGELMQNLIDQTEYLKEIDRNYQQPEERELRKTILEQMVNAITVYQTESPKPRLGEFIDQLAVGDRDISDEKDKQLARNAVALLTLHSAKGLEFPEVFLVGLEEGILPHHRSLGDEGEDVDEERRLCYVGITRAQERLTLSMALTRLKWGKPRETLPSRFLYEMTGMADNPKYLESVSGRRQSQKQR